MIQVSVVFIRKNRLLIHLSFNVILISPLGGPLIIPGETDEDDVQVGVVSWGYGCADTPGKYRNIVLL